MQDLVRRMLIVFTWAKDKEALSLTESMYIHLYLAVIRRTRDRERDWADVLFQERKRSFNLRTHCYCYCCCYYIQYRKSERERERKRESAQEEKMQLYLLQFMIGEREREKARARRKESRTLISINCSVHERQERIMQTFIKHRHSSEFKIIYIYIYTLEDTTESLREWEQKRVSYTSPLARTYVFCMLSNRGRQSVQCILLVSCS